MSKTKVYIAKNWEGTAISIVLAETSREANLYWQGKGIIPHTERIVDPDNLGTPLGILDILQTEQMNRVGGAHPGFKGAVIVKKG